MPDLAIVNASPLILLARSGHFQLLHGAAARILVPEAVVREISAHGADDPAAQAIAVSPWLERIPDPPLSPFVAAWDLGAGESAVIDCAIAYPGSEVILDDRAARRCAAVLRIACRGTLGVVLAAKKRREISLARPVVAALRDAGMYVTDEFIAAALALVGE